MPKVKISEYSTTNADNTDIEGINIAEGCAPSGINNAIRELMVHLKEFQTGASGDGFTFAGGVLISGTTNTISGNVVMSGNLNSSGTNTFSGATIISNTLSGVTQLNVDNLRLDGNTLSSTDTNGNVAISPNGNGSVVVSSAGTSDALRITQTGTGNALLVEDSTNPDATPFVVDKDGVAVAGYTSALTDSNSSIRLIQSVSTSGAAGFFTARYSADASGPVVSFAKSRGAIASQSVVSSGDYTGRILFGGSDGTAFIQNATIESAVDGTPSTNDMPGRLVFSTTADGASSPTERMRIDNAGRIGFGSGSLGGASGGFRFSGNITGATSSSGLLYTPTVQSDVTTSASIYTSQPSTQAAAFTLTNLIHFFTNQGTIGATSAVTNQYGFYVQSSLTGATNNYGFYSNIASGTGRWNFYAAGTAQNYFAGNVGIATTSPGSALDVKGTIRLSGSSSGYVGLAPAAAAGSTTYTLPSADGSSGQVLSTNGSGTLSWATVSGGSSQWTTSGSDIYYTTGKVGVGVSTFTSGGGKLQVSDGITFPATQSASSDANTLDDYEEGTWTPTYTSTGASFSYTGQTGRYIKVGSMVWISFQLTASASGTVTNDLYVTSLPFPPANVTSNYSTIGGPTSNFSSLPTGITQSTSGILLYVSGTVTTMTPTSSGMNGGGKYLWGSMVYSV